jgi:hypothetical protein
VKNNATFLKGLNTLVQMHEDIIGIVTEEEMVNVLTLAMALNYQRNSYKLWGFVVKAYQDTNTTRIFELALAANNRC